MIYTIEGLDCSGKTEVSKIIAKKLNLAFFDTDFLNDGFDKTSDFKTYVRGLNVALAQAYNSLDNFVKPRFQLSEYVYQKTYNRDGIDFRDLDCAGINKNHLVLIDMEYEKYLKNTKSRDEKITSKEDFEKQRSLFKEAFNLSVVPNKKIVLNNYDTLEELANNIIAISTDTAFDNLRYKILSCDKCPDFRQSCKEVCSSFGRPVLPRYVGKDVDFMFIGIAPGRGRNDPFSIEAFKHISGNILAEVLIKKKLYDRCYFTNVVKCNTKDNKLFDDDSTKRCLEFLREEIKLVKPKKIIVLGKQAMDLLIRNFPRELVKDMTMIYHPSYFVYNRDKELLQKWVSRIVELLH